MAYALDESALENDEGADTREGDHYLAFVLPADARTVTVVAPGPAAEIDGRVASWRDEVAYGTRIPGRNPQTAEAACRSTGAALRAAVWDPVAPLVSGSGIRPVDTVG